MNFLSRIFNRNQRSQTEELIDAVEDRYALSVRSETINVEDRSVIATAATETRVPIIDFSRREIVEEILTAEGGSFPTRMPMLDSHNKETVFSILGGASNAVRRNSEWDLRLEFDTDSPSERAFKKVQKRYITDVSVGYKVLKREYVEPGQTKTIQGRTYTAGDRPLKVATKWVGREVSVTPIGADRQAKIRSLIAIQGDQMKPKTTCQNLALELNDQIDDFGGERSELISDMALAAGVSESEVEQVLSGDATGLQRSQLDGFSYALESDVGELVTAANQDGCNY